MTHIDNSRIFHNGVYADASVLVPKSTTYKVGTVLGRDADGNLTAFSSEIEGSSPLYILAQTLINESTSASETFDLVRVFDSGVVDKSGLIFVNSPVFKNFDISSRFSIVLSLLAQSTSIQISYVFFTFFIILIPFPFPFLSSFFRKI